MRPVRAGKRRRARHGGRLASLPADEILSVFPGVVALLDGAGTILDVSDGPGDGISPAVVGRRLHDVLPVDVADGLADAIRRALAENRAVPYRYVQPAADGSAPRRRDTTIRPVGPDRVVALLRDVTADHHDRLTGLPDRAALVDHDAAPAVAVLFIDVDHFKRVNDSLGYSRGDEAIIAVADRIVEVVGENASVAHVGGDEFVVALDRVTDAAEPLELATLVRLAIARPLPLGTGTVHLTASVGVAIAREEASADSLMREADAALHHAKAAGRNRHVLFDPNLREDHVDRVELEAALHTAIEEGELRVHYQPVIDLTTSRVVGVEALVRWQRPGYGLVLPGAFVPVAEQAGIINELGTYVLRHAVQDAARWYHSIGISVAVNVSASQLTDPNLADAVLAALDDAGLPADALSLELTETAYTSASDAEIAALQRVRERGVRIALDDFGSGYSSLDRVRRFPVDVIKIDRESVVALPKDERDVTIVRAIIELAHALGVPVVAEGVEERAEHDALVRLGCDQAQGFLYARPLPPDELDECLGLVSTSGAGVR